MTQADCVDIRTKRLVLRCVQMSDAHWIARDIANPKVLCWLTNPPSPYKTADAISYIKEQLNNPMYRIICVEGVPIGAVSLTSGGSEDPDLGYWLAERAWGNGYMTEAAKALVDWHFSTGGGPVQSGWIIGNTASANVLTKLGFLPSHQAKMWAHFHGEEMLQDRVYLDPPSHKRMFDLRSERLIFDALRTADAPIVAAEWGLPEVARMTSTMKTGWTETEARDWILQRGPQSPNGFGFAIRRATDRRLIGSIGLGDVPRNLGYAFGPDYWGQGYAKEAVHAFLDGAYSNFDHIDEISADVFDDNPASAKVLGKMGFVRVGLGDCTSLSRESLSPSSEYILTKATFRRGRSDG